MTDVSPAAIYESIIGGIAPGLEQKVFDILATSLGHEVSRQNIVFRIFGIQVAPSQLANCTEDRQVRECIRSLREKDYPIISSSGKAGYTLEADPVRIDATIAELSSKIESMKDVVEHLYRSKRKAHELQVWRESEQPMVQGQLF